MEYSIILIPLFVLMVIFFIVRELKSLYRQLNERISHMEKENSILWSLILGANTNDEIKNEMSLMRHPENPINTDHSTSKRHQHFN